MINTGMGAPGNPYTFWLEARSNCDVMKLAFGPRATELKHAKVGYNLAAHALELLLKGFLLARGYDRARLKKIGHDLVDALRAASEKGMHELFNVDPRLDAVVTFLAPLHKRRAFSYPGEFRHATSPASDMATLPVPRDLVAVVQGLLRQLAPHCPPPGFDRRGPDDERHS